MEAGHQRPVGGAFHLDGMNVHGDVNSAERRSENKQSDGQNRWIRRNGEYWQEQDQTQTPAKDHWLGSELSAKPTGQWHRSDRADAQAKKKEAEQPVADVYIGLGKRDQRRPASNSEAGCEEGKTRGKTRFGAIG